MLEDLDLTLEALLSDPDPAMPAALANVDIRFEPPDRNFAPPQPSLNVFLYDVKENRELRDPVPVVETATGGYVRRRPLLRMDCSYMVTAWSNSATGPAAQVVEEHRLLGYAFAWLSRFAVVPEPLRQGVLRNPPPPQPPLFPPLAIGVGQLDAGKTIGDFWSALGVSPRPGFTVVATIAIDPNVAWPEPAVTTIVTRYGAAAATDRDELVTIGGAVHTAAGAPIPRAWVRLDRRIAGTLRTVGATRTGDDGRFVFNRIQADLGYTLRAQAAGLGEATATVDVPSQSGEYIVRFP